MTIGRAVGGLLAGMLLVTSCTGNQPSAGVTPSPSAQAATQPVLVFFTFDAVARVTHLALASEDGTVIKTEDLPPTGFDVYQDGQAGLLLYRSLDPASRSVQYMAPDGTIRQVPQALLTAFGAGAGDLGGNSLDANPAFADDSTVAGVLYAGAQTEKYAVLDLLGGRMSTPLTATPEPPVEGWPLYNLLPAGLSADGKTARLVILHAKVGSKTISTWALAEFSLPQRKMSSLKTLPLQPGADSRDIFSPTLSPSGRILVYQLSPNYSIYATAVFTTHILDRQTGKDTIAAGAPYVLTGHPRLLRFSPDGSLFYVFGEFPVGNEIRDRVIAVYDISGRSVWRRDVGDSFYNDITPVGWLDARHLVFTTQSTSIRGNFADAPHHSYAVDVLSGSERELPANLGDPVAVLR